MVMVNVVTISKIATNRNLIVTSKMFAQYIHKHTGESSGRKIHNLISHILTERKGLSDALDALSFTGTD